jgi:nicotinamide-nucleotide amidase
VTCSILTIGDELLIGQVVNTNAAFIAEQLNGIGIEVRRMATVGDDAPAILRAFDNELKECDILIVTGGLGPTHDDVTKQAACAFFKTDLVRSDAVRVNIQRFLAQRNAPWSDAAEEQTLIPRSATIIPNNHGTAAGLMFEHNHHYIIILPGVPHEMGAMITEWVVPFLRTRISGKVVMHRTLLTTGIPESTLARQLGDLDDVLRGGKLAFLPSIAGVRMRITVLEDTFETGTHALNNIEGRIRSKVGNYIFGVESEMLEEIVGRLLRERGNTIAVAESCTGGLLAHKLTNMPGSSSYFERGVTVYSNRSKTELVGVPEALIERYGAVSSEVATAMAAGIRSAAKTSIGISTTGIAGPGGGSTDKPVGLVWIGYADDLDIFARQFRFGGERVHIKERAVQAALELVRRRLLNVTG